MADFTDKFHKCSHEKPTLINASTSQEMSSTIAPSSTTISKNDSGDIRR